VEYKKQMKIKQAIPHPQWLNPVWHPIIYRCHVLRIDYNASQIGKELILFLTHKK